MDTNKIINLLDDTGKTGLAEVDHIASFTTTCKADQLERFRVYHLASKKYILIDILDYCGYEDRYVCDVRLNDGQTLYASDPKGSIESAIEYLSQHYLLDI